MRISFFKEKFIAYLTPLERPDEITNAGFVWDNMFKRYVTTDYTIAEKLIKYCDENAVYHIMFNKKDVNAEQNIKDSYKVESDFKVFHPETFKPFPFQIAGVEFMFKRNSVLLADQMGLGKMESINNRVFTPFGRKKIGDLIIGDKIIGSDGKSHNVTGIFPQGKKELYRVTFNDGFSVLVGLEHLWSVRLRQKDSKPFILTTEHLLDKKCKIKSKNGSYIHTYYIQNDGNLKWKIPVVKPIEFENNNILPIEPYLLGLVLGNGSISQRVIKIDFHKDDFEEALSCVEYKESKVKSINGRQANLQYLISDLKKLNLFGKKSNTKFIPDIYKYSSIENRIALLQGLMDTDGYCMVGKNKDIFSGTEYCTVSEKLANDVCEIVHSLGGIVRVKTKIPTYTYNGIKKKGQKAYRLNIKMPDGINPFRLKRKADNYNPPKKYKVSRYIKNIQYENKAQAVCISVDAPDSLYVTEHAVVTHNTAQALLTMNMRTDVEALIVCPSILKYNWLKEARKTIVGELLAFVYESKKIRYYKASLTPHKKKTILHIINYDILSKFKKRLKGLDYNFFIADECHFLKNGSTLRSKIAQELAKDCKYKIFITGTPIYNKPKDLYVVLNLIDPAMFNNFQVFAERYCGAEKVNVGIGGKKRIITKYDGANNLEELNRILRGNYMIRRMKDEVLKELPEKIKDVVVLDEDDLAGLVEKEKNAIANIKNQQDTLQAEVNKLRELAQSNKAYEDAYKDRVKKLRNVKMNGFGEIARIRKEIAVKKIPHVVEFVKDILENSEDKQSKVVIFGHHQEVIYGLAELLKEYFPLVITGQTSDSERQKNIMLFKEKNPHRVFIGSMGAAGTGVDGLQNNCNIVVFAELDWTPALVQQAEDRLQRIGQKNTVWVYHIVANDSIDARIAKIMVQKDNVAKQILDMKPEQLYNSLV